ncbi:MAG: hypothetical protein CM1200mP29_09240 [Verrucomicrobiota bacterium]|nr:MAG: hypothetical protein CM1200mP29_09240 [Verrucomicrobiota bacterium]
MPTLMRKSWLRGLRVLNWPTACKALLRETLAVDQEPEHVKKLYGLDDDKCKHIASQCLTARRMVERGVRFVQIYSGGMENQRSWDGHNDIKGNHSQFAAETDKPVAGLITDLAQRDC